MKERIDSDELQVVIEALENEAAAGCPVATPAEPIARFAIRRWHSVGRRHKYPTLEARISDLTTGLVATFEPEPKNYSWARTEFRHIAETVADILRQRSAAES
jgi:hypothetical protein